MVGSFLSVRLGVVVLSAVPAVILGVAVALFLTRTTLNVQSYMGAIMATGVSVANAILLVTFAEQARRNSGDADDAGIAGARVRMRPILMTSFAMIAGMVPIALALGEGGDQTAPLARAVIGGLVASTVAVLIVLPLIFGSAQRHASRESGSQHPDDELASAPIG
jgi:multidrug efflux pump subunit AcrB